MKKLILLLLVACAFFAQVQAQTVIYDYSEQDTLNGGDLLLGTDANTLRTKNFRIDTLISYIARNLEDSVAVYGATDTAITLVNNYSWVGLQGEKLSDALINLENISLRKDFTSLQTVEGSINWNGIQTFYGFLTIYTDGGTKFPHIRDDVGIGGAKIRFSDQFNGADLIFDSQSDNFIKDTDYILDQSNVTGSGGVTVSNTVNGIDISADGVYVDLISDQYIQGEKHFADPLKQGRYSLLDPGGITLYVDNSNAFVDAGIAFKDTVLGDSFKITYRDDVDQLFISPFTKDYGFMLHTGNVLAGDGIQLNESNGDLTITAIEAAGDYLSKSGVTSDTSYVDTYFTQNVTLNPDGSNDAYITFDSEEDSSNLIYIDDDGFANWNDRGVHYIFDRESLVAGSGIEFASGVIDGRSIRTVNATSATSAFYWNATVGSGGGLGQVVKNITDDIVATRTATGRYSLTTTGAGGSGWGNAIVQLTARNANADTPLIMHVYAKSATVISVAVNNTSGTAVDAEFCASIVLPSDI